MSTPTQLKADRDKLIKSLKEAYQTESKVRAGLPRTPSRCPAHPHGIVRGTRGRVGQARGKYLLLCTEWRSTFQALASASDPKQQEKGEAHRRKMQAAEKEAGDAVAAVNKTQERVYGQELGPVLQVRTMRLGPSHTLLFCDCPAAHARVLSPPRTPLPSLTAVPGPGDPSSWPASFAFPRLLRLSDGVAPDAGKQARQYAPWPLARRHAANASSVADRPARMCAHGRAGQS